MIDAPARVLLIEFPHGGESAMVVKEPKDFAVLAELLADCGATWTVKQATTVREAGKVDQ